MSAAPGVPGKAWHFLPLSAETPAALEAMRLNLAQTLEADIELDLADVASTLQLGNRELCERAAVLGASRTELAAALRAGSGKGWIGARNKAMRRPLVFLFPGVGEQYVNMAGDLYRCLPEFREDMDRCFTQLDRELGTNLRAVLFVDGWERPSRQQVWLRGTPAQDEHTRGLNRTLHAQPCMFVVEYCLARQLMRWGQYPEAVLGYSLGEFVAATLAGAISIEDALRVVAGRARLIDALAPGVMLAVPMAAKEVAPLLSPELSVGISNGPKLSVVSGSDVAMAKLEAVLAASGVVSRRLSTTHAFHSPMMKPAADGLRALLQTVKWQAPKLRCLSNVSGTWLTDAEATDPEYWVRHLCQTAHFAECLDTLLDTEDWALVEVGPGLSLSSLVRQRATVLRSDRGQVMVSAMRVLYEHDDDQLILMQVLARLWVAGNAPDWAWFHAGESRRRATPPINPGVSPDRPA